MKKQTNPQENQPFPSGSTNFASPALLAYSGIPNITMMPSILLFGRKKKKVGADALAQENPLPKRKTKPKLKGLIIVKYEISENILKFLVAKGLFKKRWVAIREIPVNEITGVESLGNELTVTWKGVTDSFVIKKKGESFSKLRDQIQGLLDEQQKTLESNTKASLRRSDLAEVINGSVGVVDLSFDMLMGLQVKIVNWASLETYANDLGENLNFAGQTMAPLSLDFSKVTDAMKSQIPKKVSQETFNVLKSIYGYFDELKLEEDLQEAHPNFRDAKATILAYYTLNDLLLGKIVGEKDNKKESLVLETALQNLAKETNFKVKFEDLMDSFDKMGSDVDVESVIEDSREIFKEQLKNIERPIEQLSTAQPPTEQAIAQPESLPPPTPQEPVPPSEPRAPAQPQTLEPVVEQQQAMQSPIEPTTIEQTESVLPSKPLEPLQTAKPQELMIPPSTEPPVIEQQEAVQPSTEQTEQPSVQQQEPAQAEVAPPKSEDTKNTCESPPKKKNTVRRLRKTILGY